MSLLRKSGAAEISTSSMADIAFLLLTFFLMTTEIKNYQGLMMMLPQWAPSAISSDVNQRNVFNIQVNAENKFLVEGERRESISGLKNEIIRFVLNNGRDEKLSESPLKAVVSFKTDRGTSHEAFIKCLDEIQAAYFQIYADRAHLSEKKFRALDLNNPNEKKIYDEARAGVPMNISMAETGNH